MTLKSLFPQIKDIQALCKPGLLSQKPFLVHGKFFTYAKIVELFCCKTYEAVTSPDCKNYF